MPTLVPAILTRDPSEVEEKIRYLESVPEITEVQIDFADGKFVPNTTAMPKEVNALDTHLYLEAHLMVQAPQHYFHDLELLRPRTVIIHYESYHDLGHLFAALKNIKALGMGAGVAINPRTEVSVLDKLAGDIDIALVMGVTPGFQGQEFLAETLDRVQNLRKKHPQMIIEVDGGVKLENFEALVAHGADRIVVGSGIWQNKDPKQTIKQFLALLSPPQSMGRD